MTDITTTASQGHVPHPRQAETPLNTAVFAALADPIRCAIVARLAEKGPMTVGLLKAPFEVSAPAISRHLNVLERAGLVNRVVDRQWRVCTLQFSELERASSWLTAVAHTGSDAAER